MNNTFYNVRALELFVLLCKRICPNRKQANQWTVYCKYIVNIIVNIISGFLERRMQRLFLPGFMEKIKKIFK